MNGELFNTITSADLETLFATLQHATKSKQDLEGNVRLGIDNVLKRFKKCAAKFKTVLIFYGMAGLEDLAYLDS